MAWRGSLSRSIISTARASAFRSSPPLPRLRPPPISTPRTQSRRFSFTNPRTMGELGCAQSLMPLVGAASLTSHLTVNVRACCELSHAELYHHLYGCNLRTLENYFHKEWSNTLEPAQGEEWKRWVMTEALSSIQGQNVDVTLYLNTLWISTATARRFRSIS